MTARLITNRGSLLFEVLIALALFSLMIISTVMLSMSNQSLVISLENSRISLYKAKSDLEDNVSSLKVKNINPCRKIISDATSTLELLVTSSLMSDYLGKDCDSVFPNPESLLNKSKNITSTILSNATSIDTLNNAIYIGSSISTSSNNFFVVNAESGNIISQLALNQSINTLDAADKYVYIAAAGTSTQFKIVDVTNSGSPQEIASSTLKNVTGSFPAATSIFYYNKKVYVGTHRTAGNEFHIYDVQNPHSPIWLGSIELNHNINMISVRDSYAYLATSGNIKDVIILNISNPSSIKQEATFDIPGTEDSQCLYLLGQKLYVGRNKKNKPADSEFVILDIGDILNIRVLGTYSTNAQINAVKVIHDFAFLATADSQSLKMLNVADPTNIQATSSPTLSGIVDLDYEHNSLYALSKDTLTTISE